MCRWLIGAISGHARWPDFSGAQNKLMAVLVLYTRFNTLPFSGTSALDPTQKNTTRTPALRQS